MAMRWSSWVATVPPPAPWPPPWTSSDSGPSSAATPLAVRPAAIAAMRSDSLTRSSPMPSISVSPSAKAAATASIGYSSIIDGARAAGTVTPLSRLALHADVADLLAADRAAVVDGDVGAHLDQRLDEAGARRVEEDVLDGHVGALDDQRGDDREGGRARVAGNGDRLRLEVAPALDADDAGAVLAGLDLDRRAEGGEHPLGVIAGRRPAR